MAALQVTCITKTASTHESITHLGGASWYSTKAQVVSAIESNVNTYYTMFKGVRADVVVVRERGRDPYLRTKADGIFNDNLLALPNCSR